MAQDKIKQNILAEALKAIPFEGYSLTMLENASKKCGYEPKMGELVFKDGMTSLIQYYFETLDEEMIKNTSKKLTKSITQNVKIAVLERIKILSKNKLVVSKTLAFLGLPHNAIFGTKLLWNTCDKIWHDIVGDKSVDFNYYSKRTLLCGVYSSTVLFWLSDESKGFKDTEEFLDRRLAEVGKIGKFMSKFK